MNGCEEKSGFGFIVFCLFLITLNYFLNGRGGCVHVSQYSFGGQRTVCNIWVSVSTASVLGMKLKALGLGKLLFPTELSHQFRIQL